MAFLGKGINTKRLNELKEAFISSILDKCFELNGQIKSLKKAKNLTDQRSQSLANQITYQKQKALRLLAFIMRVYKLEISYGHYTDLELKEELRALSSLQQSLQGKDLMKVYCEEISRWVLQNHPTFYAGSLRIINELDTEETLLKVKKAL